MNTPYATSYGNNIVDAVAVDDIDFNFSPTNASSTSGKASTTSGRSFNRAASMSWPVVNEGSIIYVVY